jgi:Arc/MetJ family transcription regulator
MRTNVVIDDDLMESALRTSGIKTKKDAIEAGLRLLVQMKGQEKIKGFRGKLKLLLTLPSGSITSMER